MISVTFGVVVTVGMGVHQSVLLPRWGGNHRPRCLRLSTAYGGCATQSVHGHGLRKRGPIESNGPAEDQRVRHHLKAFGPEQKHGDTWRFQLYETLDRRVIQDWPLAIESMLPPDA